MDKSILITICARGGSKGVKNKNIRLLNGKPLIAHTIEQAKRWGKADAIVCSTDSKQIQEVAKEYGASVLFTRPQELSTDEAGKLSVIRHALQESERILGKRFDVVLDLDVTAPLRTTRDIENSLKTFLEKKADILFTVVEGRKNPYFNIVEEKEDGFVKVVKSPADKVLGRQSAPQTLDMNTSIYVYDRNYISNKDVVSVTSSHKAAVYKMDEITAFDIDSERDFMFIEYLLNMGYYKND